MLLDFSKVRDGKSVQDFVVEPDDELLEGFFGRLTRPLDVRAEIRTQPHRSFLVMLGVSGEVEVPCRRCLTAARQEIDERTALLYEVMDASDPRRSEPHDGEPLPLRSLHDQVEIDGPVREVLFLAAETFPVCREECRGLCPICGQDKNVTECACQEVQRDSRWEKLETLLP